MACMAWLRSAGGACPRCAAGSAAAFPVQMQRLVAFDITRMAKGVA